MISIKKLIKHTVAFARITPEEAEQYHRYFLEIMNKDEQDEFFKALDDDRARDFLFELIYMAVTDDNRFLVTLDIIKQVNTSTDWRQLDRPVVGVYRSPKRKTLLHRIKETLAYTHISPSMVLLIKEFFLNPELADEKKLEIDGWMHTSMVNDQLFDLFIELAHDHPQSFESTFQLLERIAIEKEL